jgi:hypothetical protein
VVQFSFKINIPIKDPCGFSETTTNKGANKKAELKTVVKLSDDR